MNDDVDPTERAPEVDPVPAAEAVPAADAAPVADAVPAADADAAPAMVEIHPPATMLAGDLMRSMRRGDVDQMSFGFYVREEEWEKGDEGAVRTLRDVDLFDVSVVTYPAYPQTSAEARARAERVASGQWSVASEEKKVAKRRAAARRREVEILTEVMR